jgi:hypothetical protein
MKSGLTNRHMMLWETTMQNPEVDTEAIAAKLNKLWRELSEDDQLVYREKAAVEHDEVAQKQLNYEAELKTWKEAGGVLEDDVESNAPPKAPLKPVKRAATAYFLFSSEKRQQLRAEVSTASHYYRGTIRSGTVSHMGRASFFLNPEPWSQCCRHREGTG